MALILDGISEHNAMLKANMSFSKINFKIVYAVDLNIAITNQITCSLNKCATNYVLTSIISTMVLMAFLIDGCSFHYAHTHGVNQAFQFVEGIWLHRKTHQIRA